MKNGFYAIPVFWLGFLFLAYGLRVQAEAPKLIELSNYESFKDRNFEGWVMSEKLDGIRAIWDGHRLRSKQGNLLQAPDWFIEALPPFALDGELWTQRGDFEHIASIVLQKEPDKRWKEIGYHIFEVPDQPGGLMARLAVLETYLQSHQVEFLKVIPQRVIKSNRDLENYFAQLHRLGAEGLVIRDPDLPYETGRLKTALKYKAHQDAECRVLGYIEGKGKYRGMVGAIKCALLPEQIERLFPELMTIQSRQKKVIIRLGSGLSDQLRQNPPKIGQLVTFRYSGVTAKGLPRFTRFVRVRPE